MDLSFSADERGFAERGRRLVGRPTWPSWACPSAFESLDDEIAWGVRWQARLAEGRWVGVHWPEAYGGRSATPVEVALYHMAYAASGAPQPVNRVGHQPGRADPAGPRHRGAEAAVAALDPRRQRAVVPAVQRARRRQRPGVAAHPGRAGGRRRHRAEARVGWCRARRCGPATPARPGGASAWCAPTPTRPKHRGISYVVVDMTEPGHHHLAAAPDHRRGRVQRGVPRRGVRAAPTSWWASSARAGRWPTPPSPTSGARTSRSRSRSCTRATSTSCGARRPTAGGSTRSSVSRRPGAGLRRAASAAAAQLAHAVAPRPGARAGPRVELGEAGLDRHDPAPVGHRARRGRAPARRCGGRGPGSGCGPRRPRSPAAPPRCSGPSSASASSGCRDDWLSGGSLPASARHLGHGGSASCSEHRHGPSSCRRSGGSSRRRARAGGGAVAPPRRRRHLAAGPFLSAHPGHHRGHGVLRRARPRSSIRPTGGRSCRGSGRATTWWPPAAPRTAGPSPAWGPCPLHLDGFAERDLQPDEPVATAEQVADALAEHAGRARPDPGAGARWVWPTPSTCACTTPR